MELNVFTEQLNKCYNILAQQFVLIKQLKDLTTSDKNHSELLNNIDTTISRLEDTINTITNDYVSKDNFEELVRETPTDVRVVKDQNKWQLQLEHDSNVLSIDEGLQTALDSVKLYKHTIDTNMWTVYPNDDVDVNITIEVLSSRPTPYENLRQLSNDIVILRPTNVARFIEGIDNEEYQLIMFVLYSGGDEPYFLAYDYYSGEIKTGYLQIDIFNDDVTIY